MQKRLYPTSLLAILLAFAACADEPEAAPEISDSEITAEVPELDAMHELIRPIWHDAYPNQDFDAIRAAVQQFEPLLAAVDSVELPGILRHKQDGWDAGKVVLMSAFDGMKEAVENDDNTALLSHTEALHVGYEQLVRMIRPLVPELESFHQELYKVVHYYAPANDAARLHEAVAAMLEKIEPLKAAELPERLADRQSEFDSGVVSLEERVRELDEALHGSSGDEGIQAAVDAVHGAYGALSGLFES